MDYAGIINCSFISGVLELLFPWFAPRQPVSQIHPLGRYRPRKLELLLAKAYCIFTTQGSVRSL